VNLTPELNAFVDGQLKAGRYQNASEVVRAGLRALELEQDHYEEKMHALRAAIRQGFDSGIAEGDVFAQVREELGLRPRKNVEKPRRRKAS
jgi:antitoxin ParD1/3/4